jgi:predicted transcriptional regulator of viral defense system
MPASETKAERLLQLARNHQILRARDLREVGIGSATIAAAVASGVIERISRGVYRPKDAPWDENLNLSEVLARVPQAVVVLTSALNFHQIGTHQAHAVHILLKQNSVPPRLSYPPVQVVKSINPSAFTEGVEVQVLNGVKVPVTNPARTVADCFKHRSKLGLELCLEALREVLRAGTPPAEILDYARMNRVEKIMLPYVEALS